MPYCLVLQLLSFFLRQCCFIPKSTQDAPSPYQVVSSSPFCCHSVSGSSINSSRAGASVWPCGGARSQGCEAAVLELLLTPTKLLLLSSLILPLDRAARAAKKEVSGSTLVKTAQWKARRGKRAGDECPSNLMALKPHSISSLPPLPTKLAPKRMGVLSKQAPELRRCESNKNKGSSQAMTAEINTVPISGEMVLI